MIKTKIFHKLSPGAYNPGKKFGQIYLQAFIALLCLMTFYSRAEATDVSGVISVNTTWNLSGSPYIVTGNITVNSGITLTIQPGVVVKFSGLYTFTVNGTLNAQGTATELIIFTSNSTTPAVGNWYYIYFSQTSVNSVVNYARIQYAYYGLYVDKVSPTISNNIIEKNFYGINLANAASPAITNNTIQNNTDRGINALNTSSIIQNNTIINNVNYGLTLAVAPINGGTATINNNSIYGHAYNMITGSTSNSSSIRINVQNNWWGTTSTTQIAGKIWDYTDSTVLPSVNFSHYLNSPTGTPASGEVISGIIAANATWASSATPFTVVGNVIVNNGVTLTVQPGVIIKFDGFYSMVVNGTLNAQGTPTNMIKFTSNNITPGASNWNQINFTTGSSGSILKYARVQYGDNAIYVNNLVTPRIEKNIIENNKYGVYIFEASPVVNSNKITTNSYGIVISGQVLRPANPVINLNSIFGNTYNEISAASSSGNASSLTIDATSNWWGTTNIATIQSEIFDKNDNATSPQVNFQPILTAEPAGQISITAVSVTPLIFKPGSNQTSTINYTLSQAGNVTINIYNYTTKSLVRTLVNAAARNAGANGELWNGKNNSGVVLPDEVYYFTISVSDGSGNTGIYDPPYIPGSIQALNTSATSSFDPYKGELATLQYNLVTPGWVTIRAGMPSIIVANRVVINNQPRTTINNVERWDGRDDAGALVPAGVYVAYAWTSLFPSNASVITSLTSLPPTLLDPVQVNPEAFYPLYGESVKISYTIPSAGNVTVDIAPPLLGGTPVRTLVNNQLQNAGTYIVEWNGKNDSGKIISTPGDYRVRVKTVAPTGAVSAREGNVRVFK